MQSSSANPSQQSSEKPTNLFIQMALQFIYRYYDRYHQTGAVYHGFFRVTELGKKVKTLALENKLKDETLEIAAIALFFLDTAQLQQTTIFPKDSIELAKAFLQEKQYPTQKLNRVVTTIQTLASRKSPNEVEEKLALDTLHAFDFGEQFTQLTPLKRAEQEFLHQMQYTNLEWFQEQLQQLLHTKFYTVAAKTKYEPILGQNILYLKQKIEKASKDSPTPQSLDLTGNTKPFYQIENKVPNRAIQTFFRANYRNHINLSAIADNKANIMISVNAILISVLITILTYQNITTTNPKILLPVVIFLVTGLTSLIFAVLSIRPKVTTLNNENTPIENVKHNIVFFGNFVHLKLNQFEEAMDEMFQNGELLYGNMTRDLYYLGKVLDKKYRYLTISYNIFMVGFVATVISFLITIFT